MSFTRYRPIDYVCPHRPQCPSRHFSTWQCCRRTEIERAVDRGLLERAAAESLLKKYGLPMTPASRVVVTTQSPKSWRQVKLYD